MNTKVDAIINKNKEAMLNTLVELLKIKSLKAEPEKNAPYGKGIRQALDYMLDKAKEMGFEVIDMDGHAGCIDYGTGEEMLGIMVHLDVVPEGIGWKHPPFSATIEDDKIYARGAVDDKGPAVSALYALAAIKEAGLKTKRRIRIIAGCDEESGWGCMDHYKQHGEVPHLAFSPDGEYPVVNAEKGILRASFYKKFKSNMRIHSGSRANVIANDAVAELPIPYEAAKAALGDLANGHEGFTIDVQAICGGTKLTVTGKGGHASMPHLGKNALQKALELLSKLPLADEDKATVEYMHSLMKMEYHAQGFGLDFTDESGRTTFNAGVLYWDENGISDFSIDMRCPITMKLEDVLKVLEEKFSHIGLKLYDSELKDGLFVPADSELVKSLLKVYADRTGTNPKPLAIGGGTYARAFKNAVAFGCEDLSKKGSIVHMPNEHISIEDMMFNTYCIADAIIALACE